MSLERLSIVLLAWILAAIPLSAQPDEFDFFVDRSHPRLLLSARRTKLLQRERERQTMRWMQFEALMKGQARMAEPGFARALRYVTTGEREHGRSAIGWALEEPQDVRQTALVFDWCQTLLSEAESARLQASLRRGLEELRGKEDLASIRSRVFAAVALAGHEEGRAERELEWLVKTWWRGNMLPRLRNGDDVIPRTDMYPFIEILHALRDNVSIDLRQDFRSYFATLPTYLLLSYYPAVYPASENEFHIPVIRDGGEPDLKDAAMARAADLALVAYDPNATENQFLQGWSMQDRFLMRGPLGITYEFLWANPYLPGLSFYSAPLVFHDEGSGRLIARSGWDGDAAWFHLEDGVMQTFADGRIVILSWDEFTEPMDFGGPVVWPLKGKSKFTVSTTEPATYFLTGLEADHMYDIEVDDEELFEKRADHGGVLALEFPADREVGVRVSNSPLP